MRDYLTEKGSSSPIVTSTSPLTLSEIASASDDVIRELAETTDMVLYYGAKLPKYVGNKLVDGGVKLFAGYGA